MGNENGEWIMHGLKRSDPKCLHSANEAMEYIEKVGFLPLFANDIKGFSLEERSIPECWWSGEPEDPWEWRKEIARSGKIAYGKFFDKKAGFISLEWLPVFANYRRDGYDFDSLYEDGKAPGKHNKIMQNFMGENADICIMSNELKSLAGFIKGGEKGFDGAVTSLMMQLYLVNCDFRQRRNKTGEAYGWDVAIYTTPEHLWGYKAVTADYHVRPTESLQKLVDYMKKTYPKATEKQILRILK